MKRRRTTLLALTALLAAALTALPAGPAQAEEVEQVKNGTFDTTTAPWWTTGNVTAGLTDGHALRRRPRRHRQPLGRRRRPERHHPRQGRVVPVPLLRDRHTRRARRCGPSSACRSAPYDTYFEVSPQLNVSGDSYSYTFTSPVDTAQAQVGFQVGGSADPFTFCVDDVSLLGGVPPEVYEPDTGPRVRVNQVAYLPAGPKNATLVTDATAKLPWKLRNAVGCRGRPRADHAARPRRLLRAERPLDRLRRVPQARHRLHAGRRRRDQPPLRHRPERLRTAAARLAEVLLHPAQRHPDQRRTAPRLRPRRRPRRRRAQPGRRRTCPASPASATTRSTSPAAGTTPATTASTSSTAASPPGSC